MNSPAHVRLFAVVICLSLVGWLVAAVRFRDRPAKEHLVVFGYLVGFNVTLFVTLFGFERAWWSLRGAFAASALVYLLGALGRMPRYPSARVDTQNLQTATAWLYLASAAVLALLTFAWR